MHERSVLPALLLGHLVFQAYGYARPLRCATALRDARCQLRGVLEFLGTWS